MEALYKQKDGITQIVNWNVNDGASFSWSCTALLWQKEASDNHPKLRKLSF